MEVISLELLQPTCSVGLCCLGNIISLFISMEEKN